MKALSLRQPWGFAVSHLGKRIENRIWKHLKHGFDRINSGGIVRGEQIAIHASQTKPKDYDWDGVEHAIGRRLTEDEQDTVDVQRGHIICTADVIDILRTDERMTIVGGNEEKFPHYVIRPDDFARFVRKSAALPKQSDPEYLERLEQLKCWWLGPYAFHLANVRGVATPIPASGALGFWEVPTEMMTKILAQTAT